MTVPHHRLPVPARGVTGVSGIQGSEIVRIREGKERGDDIHAIRI
jgi:hypothetical protein